MSSHFNVIICVEFYYIIYLKAEALIGLFVKGVLM